MEQTKELKERYNKLSSDINGEINFKGGLEDEREINIGRQGIPHGGGDLHTNRQGEFLRETGRDIQDGRIGGRHGSPNTQYGNSQGNRFKETQQMGKDEIELSQGEQRRGLSDNVFARDIDGSSSIKGKEIEDFITREEVKMMETWGLTEELKEEDYLKYLRLKKNMDMTLQEIGEREIILI